MDILLDEKLSAEDRNNLKDSDFGLPESRSFPLNDESHIRSAIRFFKFAKKSEKRELAKNINKKLKQFDMKVKVSKSNPFYSYVDRTALLESYDNEYIKKELGIESERELYQLDCDFCNKYFYDILKNPGPISLWLKTKIQDKYLNICRAYDDYFDYIKHELNNTYASMLQYKICNDLLIPFENGDNFNDDTVVTAFNSLIEINGVNMVAIIRNLLFYCTIKEDDTKAHVLALRLIAGGYTRKPFNISLFDNGMDRELIDLCDIIPNTRCTNEYLNSLKKENENRLYIINKDIPETKPNNYLMEHEVESYSISRKIKIMKDFDFHNTDMIIMGQQLRLNDIDIMRLCSVKEYIDVVVGGTLRDGTRIYYGINTDNSILYLIYTSTNKTSTQQPVYYLLNLTDDMINHLVNGFSKPKYTRIKLKFINNNSTPNNTVSEALQINSNGDITITINPDKSYMDEYMESHRLLVENYKNKNFEGMKDNLSYMFALISIIERDKRYKKREPEIVKARAFLINDFKTYLKHVQRNEPKFDFAKYYKSKGYDKTIVNIPRETITGISKLLKTILSTI